MIDCCSTLEQELAIIYAFPHAPLFSPVAAPFSSKSKTPKRISGGGAIEVTWSGSEDPSARDVVS
jgi:hypothetical protein